MEALDSSPGVRPGDVLADKYRVERVLGQGGMGVVVAARHTGLDELVAIKFLRQDIAQDPDTVARFAREARAASKLKSEHVARVTDVDTMPDGSAYMVMEFLEGQDLMDVVKTRGQLPVEEAVGYVLDVCQAMVEAHALGIIHRDLKPENLFLAEVAGSGAIIKVLDFGVSKLVGAIAESSPGGLTGTQAVVGSPHYMSPEQLISSGTVDFRTDIWSLGVTLYELLTGALPLRGETLPETCTLIMFGPPEPPSVHRPGLPAELVAILMRCLEKEREQRFGSMVELAVALAPFGPPEAGAWVSRVAGLPPSPRASSPSTGSAPSRPSHDASAGTDPTIRATSLTRSRRAEPSRVRLVAIMVGAVVLGCVGAGLWWTSRPAAQEQTVDAGVAAHASPGPGSASRAAGAIEGHDAPVAAMQPAATQVPSGSVMPAVSAAPSEVGPGAGAGAHRPAARGTAPAPGGTSPRTKAQSKKPQSTEEDTIGF